MGNANPCLTRPRNAACRDPQTRHRLKQTSQCRRTGSEQFCGLVQHLFSILFVDQEPAALVWVFFLLSGILPKGTGNARVRLHLFMRATEILTQSDIDRQTCPLCPKPGSHLVVESCVLCLSQSL